MTWTIDDHKASAQEALDRGLISGNIDHLADVPEPQQSSEHQARVATLQVLNAALGSDATISQAWEPWAYQDDPDPDPDPGWGDGVAFGTRAAQTTQIVLDGESDVMIEGLFFDGTDGSFQFNGERFNNDHVCIYLRNCENITIRNIDFRQVSQPIAVFNSRNVTVEWNRCDGITGPSTRHDAQTGNFIQTYGATSDVKVLNNKIIGGDTEDIISMYGAVRCEVAYNLIDGTGWSSSSSTGIIAGDAGGSDIYFHDNWLLNPGQVGINVVGGQRIRVEDNRIWQDAGHPAANRALACYDHYDSKDMADITIVRNPSMYRVEDGTPRGLWVSGELDAVTVRFGNEPDPGLARPDFEFTL